MSYTYRGRTTHDYALYQRWILEGEAEDLRRSNAALRGEANHLSSELRTATTRSQEQIRETVSRQTRLEERQREYEALVGRIEQRQQDYERRAEESRRKMEGELRSEITGSEERVRQLVEELETLTTREISAVRGEVRAVQEEMNQGFDHVRQEIKETRSELETKIQDVRADLEAETRRRIAKEQSQDEQARSLVTWVDDRLRRIERLDSLGLSVERTRAEQDIERVHEQLPRDPGSALAAAQTAFTTYRTAFLESEKRLGVIDGVAEHLEETASRLEAIAGDETFRTIFKQETEHLARVAQELRARVNVWRAASHWHTFETQRQDTIAQTHQLLALGIELQGAAPRLMERLREREEKLKEIGATITDVMGPVDRFETSYANPEDPKSPRLLRAYVGRSRIDIYLSLDGTFNIDAYGFETGGSCNEAAERMGRKLNEKWQIASGGVDPTNPQTPSAAMPGATDTWRTISGELAQRAAKLSSDPVR